MKSRNKLVKELEDLYYSYEQIKKVCDVQAHLMPKGFSSQVQADHKTLMQLIEKIKNGMIIAGHVTIIKFSGYHVK
jgi:hypothetical protein